tara:strand:+ start:1702 stop:1947 length:246 start_codon:yes stop_codon:yes gene_type:complete
MTAQFKRQSRTPPIAGYQPRLPPVTAKRTMPPAVLNPPTKESTDRLLVASPTLVISAMWVPTLEEILSVEAQPDKTNRAKR